MTTDQQTLLLKAKENIEAAVMLISQGYYDIAISRLYYSMFYCAEEIFGTLPSFSVATCNTTPGNSGRVSICIPINLEYNVIYDTIET